MLRTLGFLSVLLIAPLARGFHAAAWVGANRAVATHAADVHARLEPNHPLDQVIAPNETYSYDVKLAVGQFARFAVTPANVDVVLVIADPHGHPLLKKRSLYGGQSAVTACIVARLPGIYIIAVTATVDSAPSGRYQITTADVRKSTSLDESRAQADEVLGQAQELHEKGTLDSKRLALAKYTRVLPIIRMTGDRLAEAQTLDLLGGSYSELGNPPRGVILFKQSLQMFRSLGDRWGEGMALSDLGSVESDLGDNKTGLADLTQALAIRKEAGDRRGEAETLEYIGNVYDNTSEIDRALEKYDTALALRRNIGDRFGEAQSLDDIGGAHHDIDEEQTALEYYGRALPLHIEIHDLWGEAISLNNIGASYDSLGEKKKALEYFSKTLPLKRAVGNRKGEAWTLGNMCSAESTLGEWQSALDHCNEALAVSRETGDREEQAAVLNKIGLLYVIMGEKQRALGQFGKGLALARATGTRILEATVLNNMGLAFHEMGAYPKALAYFDLSLPIRRAIKDRAGESATLSNMGRSYEALGNRSRALDCFSQALQAARVAESPRWQGGSLGNMAGLYETQGEPQKALEHFNQALLIYRKIGDPGGEASILYGIARVERDLGDLTNALSQIESALKIVETLRSKVANQQLRASYFSSVGEYYAFYIDLLMQLDAKDPSKSYAAAALGVSERSRARGLLETLQEARADIRRGVDPHLLEQERSLQQLIDGKTDRQIQLLTATHNDQQIAEVKKEIEDFLTEYQGVEAQIRASSPEYAALTQPQPLSLEEIQKQVLDEDTVLLEYALGEDRSYLWAVTSDSLASFQLPKGADVDAAARRVYRLLKARNGTREGESERQRKAWLKVAELEYPEASLVLSKMILGPVAKLIQGKRLAIVADGALQYVPFGVLPLPTGEENGASGLPLLLSHETVNLPSASVLGISRREVVGRKPAAKAVAVLADPVFDRDDARVKSGHRNPIRQSSVAPAAKPEAPPRPTMLADSRLTRSVAEVGLRGKEQHLPRLVFTRQEAKSILAMVPPEQGMEALDFRASRGTATDPDLGHFRMIHFATHGLLNSEHPELSGIVLSLVDEQGRPVNGFFDLEDVYNLSLSSDLVTLSACETGLGKEIRGEGLVGLTRGFMYSGAPRVVSSLWKVDDVATAELMGRFYRGMLREELRPAAALRQAQLEMQKQKRWTDPYYWAAFTIQGEWK